MKSASFLPLAFFVLGLASSTVTADDDLENIWAVLIAGSNGWGNYRHQADVAHAYQLLTTHGVRADHIITLMYDDIANNPHPNGSDVYAGVKIDYTGENVNSETFLNVLKGNAAGNAGKGTGRVLGSTRKERVFVYYSDHGGTNILGMPRGLLTKKDLDEALNYMYKKDLYDKLLFYLEACESGSMFDDLKNYKRIYAITASLYNESSWATYCDNQLGLPCLGDEFSVNWMEDSEIYDILKELVGHQVDDVVTSTKKSHVCQFGDNNIREEPVADYQGKAEVTKPTPDANSIAAFRAEVLDSAVNSRQVPLIMAERALRKLNASPSQIATRMQNYVSQRADLTDFVSDIVHAVIPRRPLARTVMLKKPARITALDCHDAVIKAFDRECAPFDRNPYAFALSSVFANLCEVVRDPTLILDQFAVKCVAGRKFTDVL
uniref:legumain n=1 Tax=Panagrellus redivivus TaxID=6233 RepID=A0A7E4W982_PANRE